jgi:hypothetical protein
MNHYGLRNVDMEQAHAAAVRADDSTNRDDTTRGELESAPLIESNEGVLAGHGHPLTLRLAGVAPSDPFPIELRFGIFRLRCHARIIPHCERA